MATRKKPQSISLLGRTLVSASQEASAEGRKREESKERKKKIFKGLKTGFEFFGNKILTKQNEDFLKQENFYARNALVDSNIKENQKHLDRWNNRTEYKTGESAYWQDLATTKISSLPEYSTWKAKTKPADFNTYMYTQASQLAEKMKKESKTNFDEASARAAMYGENPNEAFKNEILKNRADNVWDAISIPITNMFVGRDGRTPTQAGIDSLDSEDGLVAQGRLEKKDVLTVYEKTGNFKAALQTAEELKKFRETMGKGIANLEQATMIYGKPINLSQPNQYGESITVSIMEGTLGGVPQGYFTLDGTNITTDIKNKNLEKLASNMNPNELATIKNKFENNVSDDDYKIFQDLKNSKLSTVDEARRVKGLESFDKQFFGGIAITKESLDDRFGNMAGWTPNFSRQLASQMHIEDLKLGHAESLKYVPIYDGTSFNHNTSLLAGSEQYNYLVALKALKSLGQQQGVTETILHNNITVAISNSRSVKQDATHTPLQIESVGLLREQLGFSIGESN